MRRLRRPSYAKARVAPSRSKPAKNTLRNVGGGDPLAQPLARLHADQRRHQRQQRDPDRAHLPGIDPQQADRQGDRRDGEGQAQRLDQLVPLQPDRLQVGHGRDHEHAGRAGDQPRRRADQRPQPRLVPGGDRQADAGEADDRVDDERDAEPDLREPRDIAREHARAGDRAEQDRRPSSATAAAPARRSAGRRGAARHSSPATARPGSPPPRPAARRAPAGPSRRSAGPCRSRPSRGRPAGTSRRSGSTDMA